MDDAGLRELIGGLIDGGQVLRGLLFFTGRDELAVTFEGVGELLFALQVPRAAAGALAEGVFG